MGTWGFRIEPPGFSIFDFPFALFRRHTAWQMLKPADSVSVQWRHLLCLIALLGACVLSGCQRDTESKSLFDANAAQEGANKIMAKLKPPVRVLSIEMTPS